MSIKIKKANKFKIGICSITGWVGKKKANEFRDGKPVEVNEKIYKVLKKLNWCEIVKEKK